MVVIRVYVEKKPGFHVGAQHLKENSQQNLGTTGLIEVRIVSRYDISGPSPEEFEVAWDTTSSEPDADSVHDEEYPVSEGA